MIQNGVPLKIRLFSLDLCGVVITPHDIQSAAHAAGAKLPIKNAEALFEALVFEFKDPKNKKIWLDDLAGRVRLRAGELRQRADCYPDAASLLSRQYDTALATAHYLENEAADELA